jgi:hypothetical protein
MSHQKTTLATNTYSVGLLLDHWRKSLEALG